MAQTEFTNPGYTQYPPPQGGYSNQAYPGMDTGFNNQPPSYAQSTNYPPNANAFQPPRVIPVDTMPTSTSESNESNDWASPSFSEKHIRMAFIRKVYLILTCQLVVTVGFICFFLFHAPTKNWVQNDGFWFYYVSYGVFLVTYIILICCPNVRRKYPANYICMAIFTLAFSYMTATISCYYNVTAVLYAAGITTLVCFGVSIFACQTKIDFTKCSGLLFCLLLVLILFGFGCMIAAFVGPVDSRTARILQCVYGALGALVFSLFLAFDTQMLIGGKKHQLSEEEHVFAALQLYLDVVYIFLFILMLMGGGSKN